MRLTSSFLTYVPRLGGLAACAVIATLTVSCNSASSRNAGNGGGGSSGGGGGGGGGSGGSGGGGLGGDPATCADAANQKTYIGCDYWPTVTPNSVLSDFDFAVVVANTGSSPAAITVTGPNNFSQTANVPSGQLQKIFLPWVPSLKRDEASCGQIIVPVSSSLLAHGSAYHLVSSVPVVVYQFNALEYQPAGGPPGKSWQHCYDYASTTCAGTGYECYSYTNDASLLLPSTALTGNYRYTGWHTDYGTGQVMSITAVQDGTNVTVKMNGQGEILGGTGVGGIAAGGTGTYALNRGDVLQLAAFGSTGGGLPLTDTDPSGALVKADKPVQVIASDYCTFNPKGANACDHVEQSVFPAETLGKHYIISAIPGPQGNVVGQTVRLVGNVDGTTLTFNPAVAGAPATLSAGQVAEIGPVDIDFEVKGDKEFAVMTMMQGGSVVDPGTPTLMQRGDPSQSLSFAVEQYRSSYLFLAPADYDVNFVVVTAPANTKLTLDGSAVSQAPSPIGTSGYATIRIPLPMGAGAPEQHRLTSDQAVGIQVLGYGRFTSYQYPGGGNLSVIAPPPIL